MKEASNQKSEENRPPLKFNFSWGLFSSFFLLEVSFMVKLRSCPRSHTWRTLKVPDWIPGGWGHSWHHGSSWYVNLDLFAKFQLSSMNRSVSRTPRPQSHTWRTLMVPDWRLGGWGHPWCHGSSWYVNLDLCAKFQLSSMIRSVSRTPRPRSHTWRTLMVPDWRLWGWSHPWHVGSSWETPRKLSWKFREDLTSFGWDMEMCFPQTFKHLVSCWLECPKI